MAPLNSPAQTLRMQRFYSAVMSYAMWVSLIVYAYSLGLLKMPWWLLPGGIAATCVANLIFFWLIRSGINRRFRDPSLTVPQILNATVWVMLVVASSVREARGTFLMIYVVTFLFGVFRLQRRQFFGLTAFALTSYGLVEWAVSRMAQGTQEHSLEIFQFVSLGVVLLWLSFFGSYVHRLREILRERNADLRAALETIRDMAVHDELTGAFTRRYIFELMEDEIRRCARSKRPFSICLLDIDHFKNVNDQRGHLAGDTVLRAFSERVRNVLRALDRMAFVGDNGHALGRYGGEEFLLLLPETDAAGAQVCGERVRAAVQGEPVECRGGRVRITVSIGAAEYSDEESVESLLARADAALYQAKQDGRDRCVLAAAG